MHHRTHEAVAGKSKCITELLCQVKRTKKSRAATVQATGLYSSQGFLQNRQNSPVEAAFSLEHCQKGDRLDERTVVVPNICDSMMRCRDRNS